MRVAMSEKVNPLVGRAAELHGYATSDLSVEEQLSGGASVDDLIASGVLYDDYDPDNDPAYSFTPLPTAEEMAQKEAEAIKRPPMSEAEFKERMNAVRRYSKMAGEHRKESNRRENWI